MARELNRDLFGDKSAREPMDKDLTPIAYAKADEVRVLHLHIENISKRLREFESGLEKSNNKVEEVVTQNKHRFERVQAHFKNQSEVLKNGLSDMHNKIAQVVSRVNERRVSENIVKEMVERQSSLVQTFEVRMQQLQRVISEQELQLMNARTELKEALQELSRLKKL